MISMLAAPATTAAAGGGVVVSASLGIVLVTLMLAAKFAGRATWAALLVAFAAGAALAAGPVGQAVLSFAASAANALTSAAT